jgi:hypothetical protein
MQHKLVISHEGGRPFLLNKCDLARRLIGSSLEEHWVRGARPCVPPSGRALGQEKEDRLCVNRVRSENRDKHIICNSFFLPAIE